MSGEEVLRRSLSGGGSTNNLWRFASDFPAWLSLLYFFGSLVNSYLLKLIRSYSYTVCRRIYFTTTHQWKWHSPTLPPYLEHSSQLELRSVWRFFRCKDQVRCGDWEASPRQLDWLTGDCAYSEATASDTASKVSWERPAREQPLNSR